MQFKKNWLDFKRMDLCAVFDRNCCEILGDKAHN